MFHQKSERIVHFVYNVMCTPKPANPVESTENHKHVPTTALKASYRINRIPN